MKKIVAIFLISIFQIGFAQKSENQSDEREFKNSVKWVATSQILGRTQIAYERGFAKRHSLGLGLGFNIGGGLKIKDVTGDDLYISGLQYKSGVFSNLEYRYYMKKTSGVRGFDGFYLGAYTSFLNREADTNGWYIDDNNNKSYFDLGVKVHSFVVGIQAGYKLRIYNRWTADFVIMGPGYSNNNLSIDFSSSVNQSTIDEIRATIGDRYNVLSDKLPEFKVDEGNNKHYEATFGLPAFRYGIGIGYSF